MNTDSDRLAYDIEKQIMKKLEKMIGYEPTGMSDLLHCLTHPDLIELTETYISYKRFEGDNNGT